MRVLARALENEGKETAGSIWKKWDIHVHTPASIVHNYKGDSDKAWEAFLEDLEQFPEEFKVISIKGLYKPAQR